MPADLAYTTATDVGSWDEWNSEQAQWHGDWDNWNSAGSAYDAKWYADHGYYTESV